MKILLVANYIPDGQQSMQRYAALLEHGLTRAGHEVRVVRPTPRAGRAGLPRRTAKWAGYVDKFVLFAHEFRKALPWADIVHICDHSNAVYMKYVGSRPHVVTCHDLLAVRSALGEIPEHRTRWSGRRLQRMIVDGLARARNIVCVSDATRAEVLRILPSAERRVTRVYNALNYPYRPMDSENTLRHLRTMEILVDQPFLLHVGGNQWYKNRAGVLAIFAHIRARRPDLSLIMVGKPWTTEMRRIAMSHDLDGSALEITGASEEDLRALYSRAEALLFPSLQEGFGWPIAEALACGCPVVTSNRAPMTEVGGDMATYIDPLDHEAAAASVISVVESCRRPSPVARFSAKGMIDGYIKVYEQALDGRATTAPAEPQLRCA
jgi:glycosyltransferase involved in cell wall biosynthesis